MIDQFSDDIVIVDTDVISFIFKKDSRNVLYKPHIEGKLAAIAAQTYAELETLPLRNNWSPKRHNQLREYINEKFIFVEVSKEICLKWSQIQFHANKNGKPIGTADAWTAATALAYSIPLVTHNHKDFKNVTDLKVITENK
jgi:predicted nucleic acid-binding protein